MCAPRLSASTKSSRVSPGMSQNPEHDFTQLLNASASTHEQPSRELLSLVYEQLRKIAQQRMAEERRDHTLQATALVHEVYLRLVRDADVEWKSRSHFFAAAAEAMRRILIEHARARGRVKRGGAEASDPHPRRRRLPLSVVDLAVESDLDEILALDEAICRMEKDEPDVAGVVRLR